MSSFGDAAARRSIRTSCLDPEWWVFGYFLFLLSLIHRSWCRLLKEAPKFYDDSSWPDQNSVRDDLKRGSN